MNDINDRKHTEGGIDYDRRNLIRRGCSVVGCWSIPSNGEVVRNPYEFSTNSAISLRQMKVFILTVGLCLLYLRDPIWRRRKVSGTDAFTGVWLVSDSILLFNPEAWQFLTWLGVGCILLTHAMFAVGKCIGAVKWIKSSFKRARRISEQQPYHAFSNILLFYAILPFAIFGVIGTFISTGGFTPLIDGSIAEMRHYLLASELRIPVLYRLCANLIYPSLLIGTFAATRSPKWRHWGRFIAIPMLCSLLYSLSMGGKGCLIISASIVIWTILLNKGVRAARRPFLIILGAVVCFSAFITYTRPDADGAIATLNIYVYGPLVAMPQYLAEHLTIEWYNGGFENLAIVREISNALGATYSRSIDLTTVNIPMPYNMFTCIPEWLGAFGILGTVFLVFFIGVVSGFVDSQDHLKYVMLRVVVYVYLGFLLFADLSFLMVGWWICLLFALLTVFSSKFIITRRPSLSHPLF